ncbi:MAG: hypothetical protein ACT4PX_09700 [Actinomycetota bacterium]
MAAAVILPGVVPRLADAHPAGPLPGLLSGLPRARGQVPVPLRDGLRTPYAAMARE